MTTFIGGAPTMPAMTMKAVCAHLRGGPEVLVYEEAPRPQLRSGDALVHVHAAAITPTELAWSETWENEDGTPRLPIIPSHEVSGVVEEIAGGVVDVGVGDHVYALTDFRRNGAAAECVAVRAADLAPRPRSLDDVQAAAVPLSALTAWQALFEHGRLAAGQRLLVHGAAGGVGSLAVQLARWKGALVIGTASAKDRPFVRQLGADEVIDHRTAAFEKVVREVDLVLDTVGGETLRRSWSVLRRGGVLVSVVEPPSPADARAHDARGVFFIVRPDRAQLVEIARLVDEGKLRSVVDSVLPLARARDAYDRGLHAHHRGKIVLAVEAEAQSPRRVGRGP
jgi:NADPH:quinone reductase-like Zn-dependent oxidoreductase